MANGVNELLNLLYDLIDEGKPVPMHAEQCKIDRDRALDLLDEIRAQFPVELGEAQKLIAGREEYITSAKREADATRAQAQEQVKRMVNETEIMRQAKEVANGIVQKAQDQARELRRAASEYCEDTLARTEATVSETYNNIRQAHGRFRQLTGGGASQPVNRPTVYDAEADN